MTTTNPSDIIAARKLPRGTSSLSDRYFVSLRDAGEVTGVSARQLREWDRQGVLTPAIAYEPRNSPYSRLYSFQDLVGIRLLAAFRDESPPEELRKIQPWLRDRSAAPWKDLAVRVDDGQLRFESTGDHAGAGEPCLDPACRRVTLSAIVSELWAMIERHRQRKPEEIGRITRNRHIQQNAWVLAGTRVPTKSIWDMRDQGFSDAEILRQFPMITPKDIDASIAHEAALRRKGAA